MAAEQVEHSPLPAPLLGLAACLAAMACLGGIGGIGRAAPAMAALWLAAFAFLAVLCTGTIRTDGPRLFWPILTLGLLLRALFFLQTEPSNDIYRYVWEGWVQLQGLDPYRFSPDSLTLARFRGGPMAEIWPLINHKDYSAVYPPLTQFVFRVAAAISPTVVSAKAAVCLFELLTLACVARMVRVRKLPEVSLALYALNPLVLQYLVGEGHLDAIMAGCTAAAFLCFIEEDSRWDGLGFLLLGSAGMAKYLAFALLPFFITRQNARRLWLAAVPLLFFTPFLDAGLGLLGPVLQFSREMHYNDVLPSLVRTCLGAGMEGLTPAVLVLALCGTLAAIWLSVQDRLRAAFLASLAVLVWLPTLHPWYLALPAILLPQFSSRTVLVFMAIQVWTFAVQHAEYHAGIFQEITWLRNLAVLPVLALLLRSFWRRDSLIPRRLYPAPTSLSVIIPVLNEADRLQTCLEALRDAIRALQMRRSVAVEILVTDGDSHDETLDVARAAGCVVVHAPRGRGRQIATACTAASGDVLLVLHADAIIHREALLRLVTALDAWPDAAHGVLGMRFEQDTRQTRGLALLNALRARTTDIFFGDQGQWLRRQTLEEMGGFPAMWLMEDVECSLRAKELGPAHIESWPHTGLMVSTRGWRAKGLGPGVRTVLTLFFRYLLERRLGLVQARDPEARLYYEGYYGRKAQDQWEFMAGDYDSPCIW